MFLKANPIYKINHVINENTIDKIYVFYGTTNDIDLESLFKKDPRNAIFIDKSTDQPIFNDTELQNIMDNNIQVFFSEQQIHYDDSIGIIKLKIMHEYSNTFSLDEMYMFCLQKEVMNPVNVYQTLTQKGRLPLTRIRLDQFILNILYDDNDEPVTFNISDKEVYEYEDIVALNISDKVYTLSKPLGQKFFIVTNEYPFIANPFKVNEYDDFIEKASRKSLTTLNSHLLLNTGQIVSNNIYLCLANDVFTQDIERKISERYTSKIYFPLLTRNEIYSLDELKEKQQGLIDTSIKMLNNDVLETFQSVDLFYDLYKERKTELEYVKKGVKSIRASIQPLYKIKIPLDIIFKVLHATDISPLIKFNPATRQENVYRLFTDGISQDGKKIPFLDKAEIFKLMKTIGRSKSVAVYIKHENKYNILCEFDEQGTIGISCEFDAIFSIEELDELFRNAVNPIIFEIKNYLEQSGITFDLFHSFFDQNVEIESIDYESTIKINNPIQIKDIIGCVTSIFIVESKEIHSAKAFKKKGIEMRYKRVANFNKVTSQEAFIIEQTKDKNGLRDVELIQSLVENYEMTQEEARSLLARMASDLQVERFVKKKDIEIKINPGFKTTIRLNPITSIITILVEKIDDINYLYALPIYLDSLIRLTQNMESTNIPLSRIQLLCDFNKSEKKELNFKDVIAASETSFVEQEIPVIKDNQLEYFDFNGYMEDEPKEEPANTVLDLFFGEDYGDGDEEVGENYESSGGGESSSPQVSLNIKEKNEPIKKIEPIRDPSNKVRNVDNMKLNNPNPFQKKLEELEPILFKNPKQEGRFAAYSRSCLHNARRQPVILTEEEMQKIEEEDPGFIENGRKNGDVLKYGTNPDKQNYYMCPRYWCMKTNSPISEADVKAGKCGKIIDRDATEIKPGSYVFEFYDKSEHGSREKYKKHYPSFLEKELHAEGLCMPCCFKKWNTPIQKERREECQKLVAKKGSNQQEPEKEKPSKDAEQKEGEKIKVAEKEDYIMNPEKFPLEPNRWGYLPMSIQKFLNISNEECYVSKTNTSLKPFHTCLLRHGVQSNPNQSFIACIADAKYYGESKVPSIKEMKDIIISAFTIDSFITYQNGDLMSQFADRSASASTSKDKYINSKIYKKMDKTNEKELAYFDNIVGAFENFIQYMKDDTVIIDYAYLWDIICKPNPKIFPQGINLIILEITNNDTTDNVELICPTNHYSTEFYESGKPSLILIHSEKNNGVYYEPIYTYRNEEIKTVIDKLFIEKNAYLSKNLRTVFNKVIKPLLKNKCSPLSSKPNEYQFKRPMLLGTLIKQLNAVKYDVKKQIVNYQNKVISLIVEDPNNIKGVVPCFPSSIDPTFDYIFMSDETVYQPYEKTITFLSKLSKKSKGQIPCNPEFKVVEDEMIVGILTETNQFIQISEPLPISEGLDNIKVINNANYLMADINTSSVSEYDKERVDYIKKIKLETNFYNVFRNTVRILLNKYENLKIREQIEEEVNDLYALYSVKLISIINNLKELIKNSMVFSEEYDTTLIDEISTCIILDESKCNSKRPLCAFSAGNGCQLILPKFNLLTQKDNEIHYFGKMADELIRYNRINSFIFKPQTYLSFGELGYNLSENEMIIVQSMLTQEYFEKLVPAKINKYAKYISYDNAKPIQSHTYESRVDLEAVVELDECIPISDATISSSVWKACFPPNFGEYTYDKTIACGFQLIIDIIQKTQNQVKNINDIRIELFKEYFKYITMPGYEEKITHILIQEGKKTLGDQLKSKTITFEQFIFSDDYFITNLDIWLLLNRYNIPSILISTYPILQTNYEKTEFVLLGDIKDNLIFIVSPGLRPENIPKYKLIKSEKNVIQFPLSILNETCLPNINNALENKASIENYLKDYTIIKRATKTTKTTKPNIKFILNGEKEEEEEEKIVEPSIKQPEQTKKNRNIVTIPRDKTKTQKRKIKFEEI